MSKITTDDDEFEIDDADDSGLDDEFDFDNFNIDDMIDMEDNREPLQAFASGVIQPFKLQDNKAEIFGTIARNALPKSYGEAFDEASSLKYEASSLLSDAAKEAAPALKGVKTLAKKLLPTNSKFVPSFISKKVKQFTTEDEDEDNNSSGHTSYDPDKEGIVSTLQTIFGAERIQNDLNTRREQIKENAENEVSDARFIETTTAQKDTNYWLSRLVNYQDNITDKYLRKSLELQHLSYYALRDILQYTRTGGENTIDLLKGIMKNTGLPNEVKVTNSEILEQVSKEHLSSVVSNKIRDKLGNLPSRISENLSREVRSLAGTLGSMGSGLTDQLNNNDSFGPNPFEQQGEFASSMLIDSLGETVGKKIKTKGGTALKHVVGEDRANKITSGVEAGGLSLNRFLRDSSATMNRRMDEATYGDLSPWSILSSLVGSTGSNDEAISKKLHDNVNKPATWDLLSRKTLIEIIPGFMSRQLEQLTLIAHNLLGKDPNDVSRVIYSIKQEGFTTLKDEVEDVKKKVKNTISTSTKTNVEEILNEIDPDQKISKEDRIKIGLKLIETANKNYNFDVKDLLDSSFLYTLTEPETAEKVFKESFEVTEHIDPRTFQSSAKYGNSETTARRKDNISDKFGSISYNVGDYSKVVSDTYDTGNKDVLTEAGILNQYGYIDTNYKQKLLRELLEGIVDPRFVGPDIPDNLRSQRARQIESTDTTTVIPSLSATPFDPRLNTGSQNTNETNSEFPFIRRNPSFVNPVINSATSSTAFNRSISPIDTSLINHTRLDNFVGPRLPVVETPAEEPAEESKTFKFLNNKILRPLQGTIKTRVLGDTTFSEEDLDRFLEEGKNPDKFEEFLTSINSLVTDIKSSDFVTENKAKLNTVIENNKETVISNPLVQSATKKKEAIQTELNNSELVETIKTVVAPTLSEVIKETVRESQKIAREIIYNQEDATITKDKGIIGRAYDRAKEAIETRNDIPKNSKKQRITTALTQAKESFNKDSVIQPKLNNLTDIKNNVSKAITDNKTFNTASDYLDTEYKLLAKGIANIQPLPKSSDKRYTSVFKPMSNRVKLSDIIDTAKEEVSAVDIPDTIKKNKTYIKSAKLLNDSVTKAKKSKLGKKATKLIDTSTTAIENNDTIKEGKKFINGKVTYLSDSITPRIDSIKSRFIQDDEFIGPPRQAIIPSIKDKVTAAADDIKNYDVKENPFVKSISDFIKTDFATIVKEIPSNISDGFTRLTSPESEVDKPLTDFQTNTLRLLERMATTLDNISIIQNTNTVTTATEQGIPPTLLSRASDTIKKSWVGKAATPFIWTGGKALTGAKNFLALGTAVRKITKPIIGTGLKIGFGAVKPIAKLGLGAGLLAGKLGIGALGLAGKGLLGGLIKAPGRMLNLGRGVGKLAGSAYDIAKAPLKAGLDLGWRGAKGLTEFTGKTIAKIPDRVIRGGGRLVNVADMGIKAALSPFKMLSDIYGLGSGIVKAPFKALGAIKDKMLGKDENSKDNLVVKKLDEILVHLKKAVPIKTVDVESATNDRVGGVNELIRRRANSKKAKADTKIPKEESKDKKDNKEATDGLLSDLGDMAKSVGSLIVGFLGTKLASLFGGLGGILSKIPMIGSAASALGFGTGAASAAAGTVAAGEVVAGGAAIAGGTGIGSAILGGLGTAATAFVTFSNPIGWALLAGATAYAGYKAYKYLEKRSKLENLELLRFLQYGVPVDNTDAVVSIRKLEEEVTDIVTIDNTGKPKIDKEPKEIWEAYYEIFGCTYDNLTDNKNFMTWFYKRFIPIFVKHKVVLKQMSGNADLLDIDNVFEPKSKEIYDFVNRVQFGPNEEKVGLKPYSILSSPWHDIALSDNVNKINELTESLKNATKRGTNENGENLKSIKKIEPIVAPKKKEQEEKIPNAVDRLEQAKKEAQKENEKSFLDNVVEWGKQNVLDKFRDGINSLGRQIGSGAYDVMNTVKGFGQDVGSGMYDAYGSVQNTINSGRDLLVGNKGSAKLMMKILMEKGWSKAQAAGLAANIAAESGFRIDALGDSGKAYGIAQWHPDRQLNFKRVFRKDIRDSSFEEQVEFLDWELNNNEKKAGQILRTATDPVRAAAIVEQKFERSSLGLKGGVQPERVNAARGYFGFSEEDIQNSSNFSSKVIEHGKNAIGFGDQNFKGVPLSDLPIKSSEATAGGPARAGTMKLAEVTMGTFGNNIKQFTAFNDAYHQKNSPNSMHTKGLAFDISLKKPTESEQIKNGIESIGNKAGVGLNVINEYVNPSAKATGGHLHVNFKTLQDSEKFASVFSGLIPDGSAKKNDSVSSLPSPTIAATSKTSPYITPAPSSGLIPMPSAPSSVNLNTASVNKIPSESTVKTSDNIVTDSKPEVTLPKVNTNISPDGNVNFSRNTDVLKDKIVTTPVSEKTIPITDTAKEIIEIPKSTISKIENPMPVVKPTVIEDRSTAIPLDLKPIDLSPLVQKQEEIGKDARTQREEEINLLTQILEVLKKDNVKPDNVPQPVASSVYAAGQQQDPRKVQYPFDVNRKN